MPKALVHLDIPAPGFLGLNTQQSGSVLPPGWATKLLNFVYDDVGRIASRNGTQRLNASAMSGDPTVAVVHEYIDASGNSVNILAGDNKLWKEVAGTITDITGTATTPTADNWQFVNFNSWCIGFQVGHAPIVATSATTPTFADSGGTQYNGSMALSAYGRLWTVLGNTLRYSDLLINNFTGGSSGNVDLAKFWPNGMDEAVALADFNGLLIVFGKQSILVYENADDVSNLSLIEGIDGVGTLARDSVQVIGKDVIFLSNTGLRSLSRALADERMPLTDISSHVRDDLIGESLLQTPVEIKSVYDPVNGFYLLSFPTSGTSWYFDLKFPNQDGTWKASKWDIAPTAMMYSQDNILYFGITDGYLSTYTNFTDEAASSGTGGSTYVIDYEGVWNDLGEEVANFLKIPKNISLLAAGTSAGVVTLKWAFDYSSVFHTRPMTFRANTPSRYGTAKYAVDTYASSGNFEHVGAQSAGSGEVILIGVTTTISESAFALQQIHLLTKIGRLVL